ncbi:bifunctional uridylate/adenylate kinase [Hanseniaspora vineae]
MSIDSKPVPKDISVIFVLGGPGVGKGTQCARMVKDYGFVHLSAGDLLRAEQSRKGSEFGELIKRYITEGLIVPQEITIQLLKNAILEHYYTSDASKQSKKFLVDGFPRKMDQAITFEKEITPSKVVLFFDCSEDIMLTRLMERSKTSGREDDNIESIQKRFKTFVETSMPVVEYFEKLNKVVKIDCAKTVDEVYEEVKTALKDYE